MKLLPEDPRITAYALGEIDDSQERAAIESAVAASPELQATVASIREMSDLLSGGFAAEAAPELSEFEKAKLEPTPERSSVASGYKTRARYYWPIVAFASAAAAIALAFIIVPQTTTREYVYNPEPRVDLDSLPPVEPVPVNTNASMRAVEDLDIRQQQQGRKVAALETQIAEFEAAHGLSRGDASSVVSAPSAPSAAKPQLAQQQSQSMVSYEGFVKGSLADAPQSQPVAALSVPATLPSPSSDGSESIQAELASRTQSFSVRSGLGANVQGADEASKLMAEQSKAMSVFDAANVRSRTQGQVVDGFESPSEILGQSPVRGAAVKTQTVANTESYDPIEETDFRSPLVAPLSTFSIDVDTASYANVRRFLKQGQLPPADAVRIEELINYFSYEDAAPTVALDEGGAPFAVHMAQTVAPWEPSHHLLRIALKGYEMPWSERPASNLVFLLDVSGSMNRANKLPLVKEAMDLLVRRLDQRDRVAIVVYAGASGLVLPSTTANNRATIAHAMQNLKAGGSTNAGAGVELAYKTAREHFIEGGNNRVILCTDGDFNVGQTNRGELADIAEAQAEDGVSLTILGFGMSNYKDDMLETLSNKGKGTYAYVDSSAEARKVFLEDLASNLFKIAKDVKIQVEFNPAQVKAYRLIGYENRRLKAEDFNNDAKKAGDIGPGHTVVALYEWVPTSSEIALPGVDALRYQATSEVERVEGEVATVKLRYKQPEGTVSELITQTVGSDDIVRFEQGSEDLRFSAAVAAFGLRLRESQSVAGFGYEAIERIAVEALARDPGGHRSEFTELVRQAEALDARKLGTSGEQSGEQSGEL